MFNTYPYKFPEAVDEEKCPVFLLCPGPTEHAPLRAAEDQLVSAEVWGTVRCRRRGWSAGGAAEHE